MKKCLLLVSISACQDNFRRVSQRSGSRNTKYVAMPTIGMMQSVQCARALNHPLHRKFHSSVCQLETMADGCCRHPGSAIVF